MIDSGSQSSLISEDYISRHQLTSTPLRPAILIRGLDSKPLSKGSISHVATCKVKIGDHSELKTFGIVKMPWDLLLGVDWLRTHNLEINWKANSLCFSCCNSGHLGSQFTTLASTLVPGPVNAINSDSIDIAILSAQELFRLDDVSHLGLICLPAELCPPAPCSMSCSPAPSSMSSPCSMTSTYAATDTMNSEGNPSQSSHDSIAAKVPAKYHEFLDLFVDKEATELPPHCSHDIKIELEHGKSPPFGPIYSLTDKEKEVLWAYLADNLAKGFIRPSTSLAASPILFVKKGNGSLRLCVDYHGLNAIMR